MSKLLFPTPFADVNAVLDQFLALHRALLGRRFQAMYLVGSLALGDFLPFSSDIDFVVVSETAIDQSEFRALQAMHNEFARSSSAWAGRIEASYVASAALAHPTPNRSHYPQVEKGTALFSAPLESGWVFQCLTIRDHGVVVAGPDPHALVGPIPPQALGAAASEITAEWIDQAHNDPTWLPWLGQRENHTFVVQTLCRLLYSLASGSVTSKPRAVLWAQATLDEIWSRHIEGSLAKQNEVGSITQVEQHHTLAFIEFVLEQSRGSTT